MFTSRGYRQRSKENRKKSEYGQIIQRKPVFQIDNNPYVLDAYKQYILSTMPRLLRTQLSNETHEITLSEFSLSWELTTNVPDILVQLKSFASNVFDQYESQGKYPLSLELYKPNLDVELEWVMVNISTTRRLLAKFSRIIIDRFGKVSWMLEKGVQSDFAAFQSTYYYDISEMTLAYGPMDHLVYSNPPKMLMDVNFYTFYNSN